jgi:excisionase family DNA binding protein
MSTPRQNPNAVDVAQASELTGLSKKAIRRRLERGTLGSVKVGGKRLIPISELEDHELLSDASPPEEAAPDPAPSQAPETPDVDQEPVRERSAPRGYGSSSASRRFAPPNGVDPPPVVRGAPAPTPAPTPAVDPEPSVPPPPGPSPAEPAAVPEPVPIPAPTPAAESTIAAGPGEVPASAQSPSQPLTAPPAPASVVEPAYAGPAAAAAPQPVVPAPTATPEVGAPGYPPGQAVPVAAAPPYGYVPERGAWRYWYRYRALRWLTVLIVLALIGLVAWLLFFRSSGDEAASVQPGGGPVGVTEQDLIALSQQLSQPIYWAGTQPGTRMELTETDNSYAYIRYLGQDAPIGDTSAEFLTVGTYPSPNAFRNLNDYARNSRAKTQRIQNGGVAVVIPGSPTSVYFAYPHEDVQVEVYDPEPQRALDLVKSGVVRPVRVSTSSVGVAPTTGTVTVPTTTTAPGELPTVPQG